MKPSTKRHAQYSQGYTALGLYQEAERELKEIAEADRALPEVMVAKVALLWETKNWDQLIEEAHRLTEVAATEEKGWIAWAFALRELGRIAEAKTVLFSAEPLHGATSPVLHYNLGCYHCLLGETAEARARLATAFRMHPPFQSEALDDPDLEAMWDELKP